MHLSWNITSDWNVVWQRKYQTWETPQLVGRTISEAGGWGGGVRGWLILEKIHACTLYILELHIGKKRILHNSSVQKNIHACSVGWKNKTCSRCSLGWQYELHFPTVMIKRFCICTCVLWLHVVYYAKNETTEHVGKGLGTTTTTTTTTQSSSKRFDSMKWISFGPIGHCFLCYNQLFCMLMWSVHFPFFWSCICHYMWFTMLKMRPLSMFLDAQPFDYVFLFRRPTRLKEGPALQYVCRRVYIFKSKAQN